MVEFDGVMSGNSEVSFVRRDAEAVYLGVGEVDCAGADAGEGFPEAVRGLLGQSGFPSGRATLRGVGWSFGVNEYRIV